MGKYEYEDKLQNNKGYQRKLKQKKETPWWRDGPIKHELLTATDKELKTYIEKGTTPPNRRIQKNKSKRNKNDRK